MCFLASDLGGIFAAIVGLRFSRGGDKNPIFLASSRGFYQEMAVADAAYELLEEVSGLVERS